MDKIKPAIETFEKSDYADRASKVVAKIAETHFKEKFDELTLGKAVEVTNYGVNKFLIKLRSKLFDK